MSHKLRDGCSRVWCRLHWSPSWKGHERYPFQLNVLSSRHGWKQVIVHCGPGAFNLKPAKEIIEMKTWGLPAEPERSVTRVRGASGRTYVRSGLSFWRLAGARGGAHEWRWGTLLANDGPVTEEP